MKQDKNNFFRKNLAPIISIIAIVLATIILVLFTDNKEDVVKDTSKYLKDINYNNLVKLFDKKEDFILYVGSKNCSACERFTPNFIEVLEENKVNVYYLDLSMIKNDEYSTLQDYISISATPTVAFITEGEEESVNNRIISGAVSTTYIYDKLKVNGYIK
ncbi:MAG: thioredoxin family protein [Bacilli bacterium]